MLTQKMVMGLARVVEGALRGDTRRSSSRRGRCPRRCTHAAENLGRDDVSKDAEHRPAAVDHLGVRQPLGVDETAGALGVGHAEGIEAEVTGEGTVEVGHVLVGDAHEVEVILLALLLDDSLGSLLLGGLGLGVNRGDGWDGGSDGQRAVEADHLPNIVLHACFGADNGYERKSVGGGRSARAAPRRTRGAARCRPRVLSRASYAGSVRRDRDRTRAIGPGVDAVSEPLSAPGPLLSPRRKKKPAGLKLLVRGAGDRNALSRASLDDDERDRTRLPISKGRQGTRRRVSRHRDAPIAPARAGGFTGRGCDENLSHLALGAADEASLGNLAEGAAKAARGRGGAGALTARTAVTEEVVMAAIVCAVVCA